MRVLRACSLVLLVLGCAAAVATAGDGPSFDVYGRSSFLIHYDTSLLKADFSSYVTDDGEDELNLNPRDTRLGVRAHSTDGDWTFGSAFEIDFYGDNAGNNLIPRLRLATPKPSTPTASASAAARIGCPSPR